MKVVFLGDSLDPIPCHALDTLREFHFVEGIVDATPVKAPLSRLRPTYFRTVARRLDAEYMLLRRGNQRDLQLFLERLQPDVMCVVRCRYLLRPFVFERPRLGTLNVHPSLLPKYRGGDPLYWQYREMDMMGGVTVHFMDKGMDTGDILKQEQLPIEPGTPLKDLIPAYRDTAARSLVAALEDLSQGIADPRPQRHLPCPVPARHLGPDEDPINWNEWPIERVWHVLRGFPERCLPAGFLYQWKVDEYFPGPTHGEPGSIQRDESGYYLAHREGRIRLRRSYSRQHMSRTMARRSYQLARSVRDWTRATLSR